MNNTLQIIKLAKKLTMKERRSLPASSFAVSTRLAKKEEPKQDQPKSGVKGKYPMHDISHARSALRLVAIH